MSRIADDAGVSEKAVTRAAHMVSVVKDQPVSYGKDPKVVAAAVLCGAYLVQGEKVRQVQISQAAKLSEVTTKKRLEDLRKVPFYNIVFY